MLTMLTMLTKKTPLQCRWITAENRRRWGRRSLMVATPTLLYPKEQLARLPYEFSDMPALCHSFARIAAMLKCVLVA
jgi:hypothetical protein